jgi:hypothetical protein
MLFALLTASLLVACGGGAQPPTPDTATSSPPSATAVTAAAVAKAPAATPIPVDAQDPTDETITGGDGTLNIKLNLLNPDQQQDQYNVVFTATGRVEKGKALPNQAFLGPFTMDVAGELVLDIEDDLKNFIYRMNGLGDVMYLDLLVARVEDSHIRNPLCAPVKLAFADLETTDLGNEITVDVTDSALNDLYPEEVFIVKVVPPSIQDGGGYPRISYQGKSGTSGIERGSAGPDFLVAFPVAEIASRGIREATLVVMDENNKPKSEALPLTFDENGRCEQGALVMIETNR